MVRRSDSKLLPTSGSLPESRHIAQVGRVRFLRARKINPSRRQPMQDAQTPGSHELLFTFPAEPSAPHRVSASVTRRPSMNGSVAERLDMRDQLQAPRGHGNLMAVTRQFGDGGVHPSRTTDFQARST